jgi:hypothetical protein
VRRAFWLVACALLASCAKGEGIDDEGPSTGGDAGRDGAVILPPAIDGSVSPPTDGGGGGKDAATCNGKVVINELMTEGTTAAQEFVELYNPSGCAITLTGYKLAYKSSGNSNGPDLYNFPAGSSIAAQSFMVLGSATFSGRKDGQLNDGMAKGGGQVGLLDDSGSLVDAVGWGNANGTYTEGSAAAAPASNGSIARKTDGVDTNSNSADFKLLTTHTAGAPN